MLNYIEKNIENIPLYYFNTPQFKTTCICLVFTLKLNEKNYLLGQMLTRMMTRKTRKHRIAEKFADYLSDLYDTKVNMECYGNGDILTIMFRVTFLNNKFCEDIDIVKAACNVLEEVVFNPFFIKNKKRGELEYSDIKIEKEMLISNVKDIYNNKMLYAYVRLMHLMYKNTPTEALLGDNIELINAITSEELYDFYNDFLTNASVYYIVLGSSSLDLILKNLKKMSKRITLLSDNRSNFNGCPLDKSFVHQQSISISEEIEESRTNQSIIAIGLNSDIFLYEEDYAAMIIANGMFGGYFNSSLFQIIRERHGLAYSISSSYNANNGSIVVVAGINQHNYELCRKLILEIIEDYKTLDINDSMYNDILETTKISLISELRQADDSRYNQLMELKTKFDFKEQYYDTKHLINMIQKVNLKDVKRCFNRLKVSKIYFLKGTNDKNEQ